jgi:hypothetical protein
VIVRSSKEAKRKANAEIKLSRPPENTEPSCNDTCSYAMCISSY